MSIVKVEQKNSILWVQINRPEARNAINFAVMEKLEEMLTHVETNDNIRAVILSGSGETFISGGDLREFHTLQTAEEAKLMAIRMLNILTRIEQLPCWTIASVNAPAYGGGWEMMLAFDFRIAAEDATFGFTQAKFYLPPGWGGLTRLIERVGRSTALKWLAEAATVDTETALNHKLIDACYPADELNQSVEKFADRITNNDRDFIDNLKNRARQYNLDREKVIMAELETFSQFWETELHEQRVANFLNRKDNSA